MLGQSMKDAASTLQKNIVMLNLKEQKDCSFICRLPFRIRSNSSSQKMTEVTFREVIQSCQS